MLERVQARSDIVLVELRRRRAGAGGPGIETAVLSGDPGQPGPSVLRVRMAADSRLPPHRHPDVRYAPVRTAVLRLGIGEAFDASSLKAYPAGSGIVIPAGAPHVGWVKDGESIHQTPTGSAPVALPRPGGG